MCSSDLQVNAVKKKMAEIKKKMKGYKKFYQVVQMSGCTNHPVTAVGGAQYGFKGIQLPPPEKAIHKAGDEL